MAVINTIKPVVAASVSPARGTELEVTEDAGDRRDEADDSADVELSPDRTEAIIITAVLEGNVDEFRHLVVRYQGRLISTLYRMVGSSDQAEELAQQSFVDAFDALAKFDTERRFSTWLFRIAINNAKDWLKSHKRGERSLDVVVSTDGAVFAADVPGPERTAIGREQVARIEAALASLPVPFREVIVLKDVQGLSYAEIHEILGFPITTLKIRAVRGRAALRKALSRTDGE